MQDQSSKFALTEFQWLKLHLRLAAIEGGGSRLSYRFEFPEDLQTSLTCLVYFTDDESNSMTRVSATERREIYEGWMAGGVHLIRNAVELAGMPPAFQWRPKVRFELFEGYGMGGSLVHTETLTFNWPEAD
jgi:hypothetical protein